MVHVNGNILEASTDQMMTAKTFFKFMYQVHGIMAKDFSENHYLIII